MSGFSGDGGPATSARIYWPTGLSFDHAGNLYFADTINNRIRKVDASGIITTVAGNGQSGFGGDGGPAISARLSQPNGVTADGTGNLYIADTFQHRIRKVDPSGVITTVAGSDPIVGAIVGRRDGIPARLSRLNLPTRVIVDRFGNLYIADYGYHRIRKVDTLGLISTVAGNGEPGFSGDGGPATAARIFMPNGLDIDDAGNLYIADHGNSRIRKVDVSGLITTVAGTDSAGFSGDGGPATSAWLNKPSDLVVDGAGSIYIADTGNDRIRKVTGPT